jgi:hypothetical protein
MLPALPAAEKVLTASALTLLFVDWVAPNSALPLAPFSTFFAIFEVNQYQASSYRNNH